MSSTDITWTFLSNLYVSPSDSFPNTSSTGENRLKKKTHVGVLAERRSAHRNVSGNRMQRTFLLITFTMFVVSLHRISWGCQTNIHVSFLRFIRFWMAFLVRFIFVSVVCTIEIRLFVKKRFDEDKLESSMDRLSFILHRWFKISLKRTHCTGKTKCCAHCPPYRKQVSVKHVFLFNQN